MSNEDDWFHDEDGPELIGCLILTFIVITVIGVCAYLITGVV